MGPIDSELYLLPKTEGRRFTAAKITAAAFHTIVSQSTSLYEGNPLIESVWFPWALREGEKGPTGWFSASPERGAL